MLDHDRIDIETGVDYRELEDLAPTSVLTKSTDSDSMG